MSGERKTIIQQLDEAKATNETLAAENAKLKAENETYSTESASYATSLEEAKAEVPEATAKELADAKAENEKLKAESKSSDALIAKLTKDNDALKAKEQDIEKRASAMAAQIVASSGVPIDNLPQGGQQGKDEIKAIADPRERAAAIFKQQSAKAG